MTLKIMKKEIIMKKKKNMSVYHIAINNVKKW